MTSDPAAWNPEEKPRLLFLCQNLPYPPHGGAAIRSYHTLRLLSRSFDVTGLFFYRQAITPDRDALDTARRGLAPFCRVEAFPIPQEQSGARWLADHLGSLFTGEVYTRHVYGSDAFEQTLVEELETRPPALVHVDSLDLARYLESIDGPAVGLAHHNVESQLLARRAESEQGAKRRYLALQAARMREEEARWCPRVAVNTVVSEQDRATLERIAPSASFHVVPNGVDTNAFRPSSAPVDPNQLVFVGGHTWFPNRDGMEYFAGEVLPLIRARRPAVQVTWVGRASARARSRFRQRGIRMTGYVDDIRDHVNPAACFIVPLRVGGGTRLKILDAWALGKAVVSTPQGAEGLEVQPGENILVADGSAAFAQAVCGLLDDASLRSRLETEGRRTAVERYDWNVVSGRLIRLYRDEILGRSREPRHRPNGDDPG